MQQSKRPLTFVSIIIIIDNFSLAPINVIHYIVKQLPIHKKKDQQTL